jgi:hypothetical protein
MMLKKALTVGATAILAILASAGVASASEVNAQTLPLPLFASTAVPGPDGHDAKPKDATHKDTDAKDAKDTDAKDGDAKDGDAKDGESASAPKSEAPHETKPHDSDSKTDEPDTATGPDGDVEEVELPAPAEAPGSGPLDVIQSLVTSLFG